MIYFFLHLLWDVFQNWVKGGAADPVEKEKWQFQVVGQGKEEEGKGRGPVEEGEESLKACWKGPSWEIVCYHIPSSKGDLV